MLKHSHLYLYPSLESCLVALLAYASYVFANGIRLSGTASMLFCAIALKHYAYDNMSLRTQRTTKYMFRVLSELSSNFVFIYLGVTLFTKAGEVYYPILIIYMLGTVLAARYFSVVWLSSIINWINRRFYSRTTEQIPRNLQLLLWWGGVRGALTFALSFEVVGVASDAIRTTTLMVTLLTILGLGGTINQALEKLQVGDDLSEIDEHTDRVTGAGLLESELGGNSSSEEEEDGFEDWDDVDDFEELRTVNETNPKKSEEKRTANTSNFKNSVESVEKKQELSSGTVRNSLQVSTATSEYQIEIEDDCDATSTSSVQKNDDRTHWFLSFDERWMKPIFTAYRVEDLRRKKRRKRRKEEVRKAYNEDEIVLEAYPMENMNSWKSTVRQST
ncbi:monovalent cation:H+ antiporter, CPA1 (nhx1) [Nowakowskiella sp. JEL0407]|nr:monovalent cation:H+ antiporter, CPA1 (nhx1) [Nowakowskiella sp. JEL0407]